jgi:ABC-2 type transport system permease protein
MMSTTRSVAATEIRRRIRNRSALLTAVVAPLAMAVVFGLLLGGADSLRITIGVVDADGSELTTGYIDGLLASNSDDSPVEFVAVTDDATARTALDDTDIDAAIVLPAGFGAQVTAGAGSTIDVLRDPRREISGEIARSVAGRFADGITTRTLAAITSIAVGAPLPDATALAGLDETVGRLVDESPGGSPLDATAYFGVSMSILFLFFTISFAAQSLARERRSGVLDRLLAADARPAAIVAGKVLAVSLLGLAGFVTVWVVTTVAFGATWGDPVAVFVTMVATVLAVGGVAMFVSGFARTPQQAESYTSAVAFVLALLGGNFIGPGQAPPLLDRLSRFTPNGQSLRAFTSIATDGASAADVADHLLALVAIAVVFGAIGLVRTRQAVQR